MNWFQPSLFSISPFLLTGAVVASVLGSPLAAGVEATAAPSPALTTARHFGDGRDWFSTKRFGLFIHWGIYAIPGWHEQDQWRRHIPRAEYEKLARQWNPTGFDPDAWIDQAQAAGMTYLCFTTKHHDGFCLWDSKATRYTVMNTPFGKDVLKLLAEACHRRKFPLCLYYSIVDWHHPNYPNQGRHHELPPQAGDQPDLARYLDFLKAQVRELCTNYGEISGFWWDMNVAKTVDPSINAMIRQLQPKAVINNRGFDEGDFGTPERDYDRAGDDTAPFSRLTEACNSVGAESWGFRRNEDYYTDRTLERGIDSFLARGANYLLNVGPDATGRIPAESAAILKRIGAWYGKVRESLEGTIPSPHLTVNHNVLLTRRGNTLYVHLVKDQASDGVKLFPLAISPRSAVLLNTGQPVECAVELLPSECSNPPGLHLRRLPINDLSNTVPVVRLEFDNLPDTAPPIPARDENSIRFR